MKTHSRKTLLLIPAGVVGFVLLLLAIYFGLNAYYEYRDTKITEFVSEEDELRLRQVIGKPEGTIERDDLTYYYAIGETLGGGFYTDIESVRQDGRVWVVSVTNSLENTRSPEELEMVMRITRQTLTLNLYFYNKFMGSEPQFTADDVLLALETMERQPVDDLFYPFVRWHSYWEGHYFCTELRTFYLAAMNEFEEYANTSLFNLTTEDWDILFDHLLTHEDYRDIMEIMLTRNQAYLDNKEQSEE